MDAQGCGEYFELRLGSLSSVLKPGTSAKGASSIPLCDQRVTLQRSTETARAAVGEGAPRHVSITEAGNLCVYAADEHAGAAEHVDTQCGVDEIAELIISQDNQLS